MCFSSKRYGRARREIWSGSPYPLPDVVSPPPPLLFETAASLSPFPLPHELLLSLFSTVPLPPSRLSLDASPAPRFTETPYCVQSWFATEWSVRTSACSRLQNDKPNRAAHALAVCLFSQAASGLCFLSHGFWSQASGARRRQPPAPTRTQSTLHCHVAAW